MTEPGTPAGGTARSVARLVLVESARTAFLGGMVLGAGGRLDWWAGWVLVGLYGLLGVGTLAVALRGDPSLLDERLGPRRSDLRWDKAVTVGTRLTAVAYLVASGLDHRLAWSQGFPPWLQVGGAAAVVLGHGLFLAAMASNRFFSAMVRLQAERGHVVATGGPYRVVRHPGYAGISAVALCTPALLGSWWGLLPAAACAALTVLRAGLEDRWLHAHLAGYGDYARRVRYRLLPGIW